GITTPSLAWWNKRSPTDRVGSETGLPAGCHLRIDSDQLERPVAEILFGVRRVRRLVPAWRRGRPARFAGLVVQLASGAIETGDPCVLIGQGDDHAARRRMRMHRRLRMRDVL